MDYRGLQGITKGYRGLQLITLTYKGLEKPFFLARTSFDNFFLFFFAYKSNLKKSPIF